MKTKPILMLMFLVLAVSPFAAAQELKAGQSITVSCETPAQPTPPKPTPNPTPKPTPPPVVTPPPSNTVYSCGRTGTRRLDVQGLYNAPGNSKGVSNFGKNEAYVMSFTTGAASKIVKTLNIAEWSGQPVVRIVTISKEPCNMVSPLVRGGGIKVYASFVVGTDVPLRVGWGKPQNYPRLEAHTKYYINMINYDPRTKQDSCTTGRCGFVISFTGK